MSYFPSVPRRGSRSHRLRHCCMSGCASLPRRRRRQDLRNGGDRRRGRTAPRSDATRATVRRPRDAAPARAPRAAGSTAVAAAAAAAAQAAQISKPFADVVKDAQRNEGLFTLWQKDDKV